MVKSHRFYEIRILLDSNQDHLPMTQGSYDRFITAQDKKRKLYEMHSCSPNGRPAILLAEENAAIAEYHHLLGSATTQAFLDEGKIQTLLHASHHHIYFLHASHHHISFIL